MVMVVPAGRSTTTPAGSSRSTRTGPEPLSHEIIRPWPSHLIRTSRPPEPRSVTALAGQSCSASRRTATSPSPSMASTPSVEPSGSQRNNR